MIFLRVLIDKFLLMLLGTIVLASFFPIQGEGLSWFSLLTKIFVGLLFFLHGARLSRESVVAGIVHWRLHLVVILCTFVLFPILGLLSGYLLPGFSESVFYMGILYLCILPSTVQSSIAFTSIAGGNVPAAIVAASASNILGMFFTPLLVALLFTQSSGFHFSAQAMEGILLQLLAPFVFGQILQGWIGNTLRKHKGLTSIVDRGSILMVVYLAFSEAVNEGLWKQMAWTDLFGMMAYCIALLVIVLLLTWYGSKMLGFNVADRITIMFCGSKKSLASGAPMASAIFPAAMVGPIVLPVMLFHQIQLIACTIIARHIAERTDDEKNDT